MEKKELDNEIKTTGNLQLEVYTSKCTRVDSEGRHPEPDEIGLFIHGYSTNINRLIADMVTINKEEAKRLATVLLDIASK